MEQHDTVTTRSRRVGWKYPVLISLGCLLINILGKEITNLFSLPLYLDSIGTILASVMCGGIPGIAVGFLSNIINNITDPTAAYYGVLNILIAVFAAFFDRRNYFKRFPHIFIPVLTFVAIGGGLGSLLTWGLYGFTFGSGVSAPLAHFIHDRGVFGPFASQLSADLLVDLADKTISVAIAAVVLYLLPHWRPAPTKYQRWERSCFPDGTPKDLTKGSHGLSLHGKFLLLVSTSLMAVAVTVTFISYNQFHNTNVESQINMGKGVANVAKDALDKNRLLEFMEQGPRADGYTETKQHLTSIMNSTDGIEYVYVYHIEKDGCHVIFDPDTPDQKGATAGTVIPFDDAFRPYTLSLLRGEPIDPIISDETYGWLLTIYDPVYDSKGNCVAYVGVDISMATLIRNEYVFLTRIIALFLGFFALILAIVASLGRRNIIHPINSIALASNAFAYKSEGARADSLERLKELDIRTGDEIEHLYSSFVKTSEDMVAYIEDAQAKSEQIARLQNGLILMLADMVESRDKCTGNHVRNTASYVSVITKQMREEGIYADQLSDDFIFDVVSTAPLHDVGKIKVPDAILNKPGKLTEEEFKQMKNHSAAGGEIIEKALSNFTDEGQSGFLNEAMNLASYHHERWDGKGYPKGLAGEEIPLSARIMAVADVFDALVARRSYKPGFPFEKAVAIITEGKGTQFDPRVVDAFLHAEEEIRKVCAVNQAADEVAFIEQEDNWK